MHLDLGQSYQVAKMVLFIVQAAQYDKIGAEVVAGAGASGARREAHKKSKGKGPNKEVDQVL